MTQETWGRVKAIVADAMEVAPAERSAFVQRACGSDGSLRQEVESLLAASQEPGSLSGVRGAIASEATHLLDERDASVREVLEKGLGHQYEILRAIGRGGMGEVYLARERALERLVGIKVLRPDLAATPGSRERFRREARMAAQLSHPGIVGLHTFGEFGGVWFFVMEYVRGQTLGERLRLEGRIPSEETQRIVAELADALDCAHRHGIIHRDIKPANILLDEETGKAVLADFGISKSIDTGDSLTGTGVVIGTPDYMAPEQALGSDVDARSDIYSLGAVAYTMLSGRAPFAASSTQAVMYRSLSQDPTPLATLVPSLSQDVAEIVMKCLSRDPALRWQDAKSLREAMVRAGSDGEVIPEELRELPSFAPYALLWAVAWSALAILTRRSPEERVLLLLIGFLVPIGLLMHVWHSGGYELRLRELVRVASWPPEWWGMWWPSFLRRPSDVWGRLPWWPARFVRLVISAFFVAVPTIIALRQRLGSVEQFPSTEAAHNWLDVAQWLVLFGTPAAVLVSLWWAREFGFSLPEATRFLFGSTLASRFWGTPRVAKLLAPPRGRVRTPDRDSPADHRRAIDELARLLPDRLPDGGKATLKAADDALRAVEASDRELEALVRDAGIAEPDRLAAQLTLLGDPKADEGRERRELRELLQHQLDVARRVRDRSEAVKIRRSRYFELLRGLWTQLRLVEETPVDGNVDAAADRLRVICNEITAGTK